MKAELQLLEEILALQLQITERLNQLHLNQPPATVPEMVVIPRKDGDKSI